MGRYIMPVIEITDADAGDMKQRKAVLHKGLMAKEVDAHSFKFVDASGAPTLRQENAISSDTDEALDGSIVSRLMDYRDAMLRKLLEAFMQKEDIVEVDNLTDSQDTFVYNFSLPVEFNDAILRPLCILMHKYIVWGCLFDWYTELGATQQANNYGRQLKDAEEDILSMVSSEGYAKRPLQPFGPANKY